MNDLDPSQIALIICSVIFIIIIFSLIFCSTSYFRNLTYIYNLPVVGTVSNIQNATIPRMGQNILEPSSSEEPTSSEEPSSDETFVYSDQSLLIGLYSNERRNMSPYGNYKIISPKRKQ